MSEISLWSTVLMPQVCVMAVAIFVFLTTNDCATPSPMLQFLEWPQVAFRGNAVFGTAALASFIQFWRLWPEINEHIYRSKSQNETFLTFVIHFFLVTV